ncbi:MAG: hypothetical protein ABWZ40_00895 [Caulobacterales bacterium]
MFRFVGKLFAAYFLCLCLPALADPAPTTSLEDAQQLISKIHAEDVFEPVAEPLLPNGAPFISVRHIATGYICRFNNDALYIPNALAVFPSDVRGNDVGCTNSDAFGWSSIYLTKDSIAFPLDERLKIVALAIKSRSPEAAPYTPKVEITATKNGVALLESKSAAFLIQTDEGQRATHVHLAERAGWVLKQRFTGKPDLNSDMAMGEDWMAALGQFASLPLSK